jgi:hypothetical protein
MLTYAASQHMLADHRRNVQLFFKVLGNQWIREALSKSARPMSPPSPPPRQISGLRTLAERTLWYQVVNESEPKTKVTVAQVVNCLMNLGGTASRAELITRLTELHGAGQRTVVSVVSEAVGEQRIRKERSGHEVTYSTL